jgi:uncharacterized protein YigE (DUF2233 family)
MLVTKGKIHPRFASASANKTIRSGVWIIDEDKIVFIISGQPVNFYDFATLFKEKFGCRNALYLDCAISKMYLHELNLKELDNTIGFASFICVEGR